VGEAKDIYDTEKEDYEIEGILEAKRGHFR
jgi:hypothetical protein